MITSSDFHKSGAKVRRFVGICKETGGAGQNLIYNSLSVSGLFSRWANQQVSRWAAAYPALWITKTYTYTAYTDPEYQGVTNQVPYTGGSTDTYTGKSFNKMSGIAINFSIL